jgi:WD40 repeat protein
MPVTAADQTNVLSEGLKVWDVESSQEMPTLERHNSSVRSVALSPSGQRMVSGSEDKTLNVWKADSVAIG